jgi:hypothetical protein
VGLTLFVGDSLRSCGTPFGRVGLPSVVGDSAIASYGLLTLFAGVGSLCSRGCSFHSLFAESANFGKGKFGGGKRFFGGLALEMGLSKYE